jgi:hypothetical protein
MYPSTTPPVDSMAPRLARRIAGVNNNNRVNSNANVWRVFA